MLELSDAIRDYHHHRIGFRDMIDHKVAAKDISFKQTSQSSLQPGIDYLMMLLDLPLDLRDVGLEISKELFETIVMGTSLPNWEAEAIIAAFGLLYVALSTDSSKTHPIMKCPIKFGNLRLRVGKSEFGKTIDEGTFSKFTFARQSKTGELVSLKILDKEKIL
ncbi:hypothetical protein ACFE04_002236 [Oxalis oulophora]